MQSEKPRQKITTLNSVCTVLIILFCFTLFSGYERVCEIIYPGPLKIYRGILGDKTKNYRGQKLSSGHIIKFQFKDNKKSLGELYSLTDVKFVPNNKAMPIWSGADKPKTWTPDTASIENMQRFRIRLSIPLPDDKNLDGQTIKGTLHFKLEYPVLTDYTRKISATISEIQNKTISIHIFSKDEINILSQQTNQMLKIWIVCLFVFLLPVLLIVAINLRKNKKIKPPRVV